MNSALKEKASLLPQTPGVYLMKNGHGDIVYVGKAKKLKNRVSSYFIKNKQHSRKTVRMIQQLADFEIIDVPSELDALLLECQLIHELRPIYNRQLNTFEKYKYIEINTEGTEIAINILSIPTAKHCFGPFSTSRKLGFVKRILETVYGLNRQSYWHQTFTVQTTPKVSRAVIEQELFNAFTKIDQRPQQRLKAAMLAASENYEFEKAIQLREEWHFLTRFFEQNRKLILASQSQWQLLFFPLGTKIEYYLIYQGLVINSKVVTKRTFNKYTPDQLAQKLRPNLEPQALQYFSKDQVDFINILYGYINRHPECQLLTLANPFT
ncbi:excinuclease ABC [Erwinia sp. CPCC 100877]|nr:excinuclease ABC [Erwinia sp. CPCC 100877]